MNQRTHLFKTLPFITLICLLGCRSEIRYKMLDKESSQTIVIKPERSIRQKKVSDIYEILHYIPLETTNEVNIANIKKLIHSNKRFYILDDIVKVIYCFNEDGSFRYKIDRTGKGPGEYVKITDFSYNNEKLYLLDVPSQRVNVFNDSGEFLHEMDLQIYASDFEVLKNDIAVYYINFNINELYKKENTFYNVLIANNISEINQFYLPYHENIHFGQFTSNPRNISRNHNEVSIWQKYDNHIYKFINGSFLQAYEIEFKNNNNKHARKILNMLEKENLNAYNTNKMENRFGYCTILDVIDSPNTLYFVYKQGNYFNYVYFDKNTHGLIELSNTYENGIPPYPLVNDIDGVPYYPILTARDNVFYSYTQPNYLINNELSTHNTSFVINDLQESDNPVIVMLKIKSF